jgi:hypothetical protein
MKKFLFFNWGGLLPWAKATPPQVTMVVLLYYQTKGAGHLKKKM